MDIQIVRIQVFRQIMKTAVFTELKTKDTNMNRLDWRYGSVVKSLACFPEHPGSNPSTHMVAQNHL